ncbi:MAG: hypothetical protein JNL21_34510 [Myxococcales bacterium]|nr:hypothetical protein [Myxococcales bacterium]
MTAISQLLFFCGAAGLLGTTIGCEEEEEPTEGDEQDASSSIDDVFAKTALKGGCAIKVAKTGKTSKTTGKGGACPTTVTGVLDALAADTNNVLHVYAVSEQADGAPGTKPDANTPYRFVVAVETKIGGTADKLFLSMLGSGEGVSDTFLEVMSFNAKKGVYAFYDLNDGKWIQEGDGSMVPTAALGADPAFRCLGCHTTGAPLMKELHDSWANWNSTWLSMADPGTQDRLFRRLFDQKERADDLELHIIEGTKASTKARVKKALKEKNLKPLMTQLLCDVGEPSLIASHMKSSQRLGTVSTFSSMLPSSILLNNLFKTPQTGTGPQDGMTDILAMNIPALGQVRVESASYVKALGTIKQKIGGQTGDAMFPMSSPEKSFADFQMIQELFEQKLVDKDVIADALMTDFTVSTFSSARCALADTLPKTWASADELRTKWAESLGSSDLRGAAGLKARLEKTDDFAAHEQALGTYVSACNTRSTSDKDGYALDLLKVMSQRRAEFKEHYEQVVESDWLIPTDNLGSTPGAIRLNGTTCAIENQSAPFIGE